MTLLNRDEVEIWQAGAPSESPAIPEVVPLAALLADWSHPGDAEAVRAVRALRVGETARLPGIGRPCITRFNPVQAWLLRELPQVGGAFGHLPIGSGKSLAGLVAPMAVPGVRLAVLLGKTDQRYHYALAYRQAREHFRVPSFVIDTSDVRGSYIVPGAPVTHFVPYSIVQQQRHRLLLDQLDPDMILADEAHKLSALASKRRGAGSGTAGRVIRYMARRNNEGRPVLFACWSGSLVNKTILDMTHLSAFSLGTGSPYPIDPEEAARWADVVDVSRMPDTTSSTAGALRRAFGKPVVGPMFLAGFTDSSIREGLQKRVVETPGVISARSASVNCSISIHERDVPKLPEAVREALAKVRAGVRPDGDVIEEQVRQVAIARTTVRGLYPVWVFPGVPCDCEGAGTCDGCLRIDDWYAKRKEYAREARAKLLVPEVHLDTSGLLENAARRAYQTPPYAGDLPVWPAAAWPAWAAVKDTVPHVAKVRWIDDFFVDDAVAWSREHRGILWFETTALGRRVAEKAGIPYFGADSEEEIMAVDGKTSIVASISAHSEGRDGLQLKFSKQYVMETPASGKGFDQLLGRLAREGQAADCVETWVAIHESEDREAFKRAISYAEYDEEMSPTRNLLLAADLSFEP